MVKPAARYLVTGGAGFIGSHLCDALLAAGHAVAVLDDLSTGSAANLDRRVVLHQGDVGDATALDAALHGAPDGALETTLAGVAGIFHLAAIASVARGNEDWPGTHRVNQGGTVAVLDAARRAGGVPVIYASSAAVYGNTGGAVAREDQQPLPLTAYGADKLGSELHAGVGTLVHGVPALGLRFFNVYGPRQDPSSPYSGVISIFAARIAAGLPVTLHGGGAQTRDFIHVNDVVAHLLAAMTRLRAGARLPRVLNVCTGRPVSIRQLAERLAGTGAAAPQLVAGPARPGDIKHSCGCPEAAAAALGLRARVTLEVGLRTLG